jgi:hypothetical protein
MKPITPAPKTQTEGKVSMRRTSRGNFKNVALRASALSAVLGFGFLRFVMVNVPFLLGVWGWTVQPFYRR